MPKMSVPPARIVAGLALLSMPMFVTSSWGSNYCCDLAPYTWQIVGDFLGGRALFIQPPCRSYAPAGYQPSISAG
jgi:hypothetical protein